MREKNTKNKEELKNKWPPEEFDRELAEIGRLILHYNAVEKHTEGVLRQLLIDDFSDRAILVLVGNMNNHDVEKNLAIVAHSLSEAHPEWELSNQIAHLNRVFSEARNVRNRIVHEIGNYIAEGSLILTKHYYRREGYYGVQLKLTYDLLKYIVDWLQRASEYSAKIGIEISFLRGLRDRGPRWGWPEKLDLISWEDIEKKFSQSS